MDRAVFCLVFSNEFKGGKRMTILVTGGAGYIGSHTCVELLQHGYDIIVVDNFSNSRPESLHRVKQITGRTFQTYYINLLDKKSVEKVFLDHQIDAVIHFAGLKAVGESVAVPLQYYQNNVKGSLILFEVMEQFSVKKLIFSSSATVYGNPKTVPITEDVELRATNPYGRTKQMIEEILLDTAHADSSWSIALLRYFNPIGAHESGLIGEDPEGPPNNLLPYISQIAIGRREQLRIFGNNYPTADGTGVRDYIHVVDLAMGHLKALEHMQKNHGIEAYNLGTGKGYSVLEVVDAFERVSGNQIPYTFVKRRPGDISSCFADPAKAKKQLAWQAMRGIEEMCADAWRWQRNNPTGYRIISEKTPMQKPTSVFLMH